MECGILLQPLLSLAKEVMCFLSRSTSPTGQDLLFYHCDFFLGVVFVCLPGLTSFFVICRDIPTSFHFPHGHALHWLQAQLKRTKKTRRATAIINFVSKANVNIPRLMVRSCRVNGRGGTGDSRVIVVWVRSFRRLSMVARWRRSASALESLRWTFTLSIRGTSKVTGCFYGSW